MPTGRYSAVSGFNVQALSLRPASWGSRRFAPFIAVLQTSHPRKGYHASTGRRLRRDYPGLWCIFVQAQMAAILVILGDELTHHSVKLPLVEHDDLVQQLAA